ncbi:MAG TPA: MurR/RpiR family transcriptional regulator [Holophaga sp.]|nr:MurR/RpiR family transcriptional regulator [Holophaga sp.]
MPRRRAQENLAFLDRLTQAMPGFSQGQRRLADVLLKDPDGSAYYTAAELGRQAGISEPTVVRFAKTLGYGGFPEMRQALAGEARQRIAKQARLLHAPTAAAATLVEVARNDIANIERVLGQVNEESLARAVELLVSARHRVLVGRGISQRMAQLLGYLLTIVGLPSVSGEAADTTLQVANLGPEDLLVAMSFHPYSKETVDAVVFARSRGVKVMAFTDRLDAPIAPSADQVFLVPGENLMYTHSVVAFGVLSNALVTAIAASSPETALQRVRAAERAGAGEYV